MLYFGDYAGRAYAIRRDGHQMWAVGTNGAHFGFGSGQFYSTPAVAFGRVYMGNTDGRVYSFGARNGALAWATAPAPTSTPRRRWPMSRALGPTVYIGSYDGNLYAFNAQSGAVRWSHPAGGQDLRRGHRARQRRLLLRPRPKTTAGVERGHGRRVFTFPDGAFTPVIADQTAIYLTATGPSTGKHL